MTLHVFVDLRDIKFQNKSVFLFKVQKLNNQTRSQQSKILLLIIENNFLNSDFDLRTLGTLYSILNKAKKFA